MKKYFYGKMIIASAIIFSAFTACKKNSSNPYGSSGGNTNPGTNQVYMQNSKFNPSSLTVSKGTTITWTNQDNIVHTVTSNSFDSGDMSNGKTFSYKFNDAGTYNYYCKYHQSMGMTGTVVVQ